MPKICIDPGHGGIDPGAVGPSGLKECDVVLAVALIVAPLIEAAGIEVVMTRTAATVPWSQASTYNDLHGRTEMANAAKVDVFLSIHCDSNSDSSAHGTTGYCYALGANGEKLARAVKDAVVKAIGANDRGVKAANFQVLRDTDMPAALVEMAFISSPAEEKLLADPAAQKKLAVAIAQGVCGYFNVQYVEQQTAQAVPSMTYAGGKAKGQILADGKLWVKATDVAELFGHNTYHWDPASSTLTVQ